MMKEKIIKWWNQLRGFYRTSGEEESGQSETPVMEQILPEGDNSPVMVLNESNPQVNEEEKYTPVNNEADCKAEVGQMSDIEFIETEGPSLEKKNDLKVVQEEIDVNTPKSVDVDKLVSMTIDSIRYFDQLRSQMHTDDLKALLDEVSRNLIDNLIMSGCASINEEPGTFNMARHQVIPFQMITNGSPYQSIKRPGVEYKGEVKLLAIVEL